MPKMLAERQAKLKTMHESSLGRATAKRVRNIATVNNLGREKRTAVGLWQLAQAARHVGSNPTVSRSWRRSSVVEQRSLKTCHRDAGAVRHRQSGISKVQTP